MGRKGERRTLYLALRENAEYFSSKEKEISQGMIHTSARQTEFLSTQLAFIMRFSLKRLMCTQYFSFNEL